MSRRAHNEFCYRLGGPVGIVGVGHVIRRLASPGRGVGHRNADPGPLQHSRIVCIVADGTILQGINCIIDLMINE